LYFKRKKNGKKRKKRRKRRKGRIKKRQTLWLMVNLQKAQPMK
jgi:hypothetical protein